MLSDVRPGAVAPVADAPAVRLDRPGREERQGPRRRERVLQRFTSPAHAQEFLSPFGPIADHFRPRRHRLPAPQDRQSLQSRFATWREVTGLAAAT